MTVINWVCRMIDYEKLLSRQSGKFRTYFHEASAANLASFDWFYRVIYPSGVFLCSLGVIPCCLLSATLYTVYTLGTSGNSVSTPKVLRLVYLPFKKAKYSQIFTQILIWLMWHNGGHLHLFFSSIFLGLQNRAYSRTGDRVHIHPWMRMHMAATVSWF